MSFAKSIKESLTNLDVSEKENLAEMSALLHLNSEIVINEGNTSIEFKTSNPTVARRFVLLIKKLYNAKTELITKKEDNRLKRKYSLSVKITSNIDQILSEHNILDGTTSDRDLLLGDDITKMAYLRGAFIASGSVNDPKKAEYHLEIYTTNPNDAIYIQKIINHFDFNARITTRRKGYIVYLKDKDSISYFIQMIGAQKAFFDFQDYVIQRDLENSIVRVMNCELANEKKAVETANKQLNDIELIEKYLILDSLSPKLKEAIELRKENPDSSLRELMIKYEEKYHEPITKSGLNHRFLKIKEIANDIIDNKE